MEKLWCVLSSSAVGNIAMLSSSVFAFVAIIVNLITTNKQLKESKAMQQQQKEQYDESIKLQKDQYEREIKYNQEISRIQERPFFTIDKTTNCSCSGNSDHHITIYFKNKGNGSAFSFEPETELKASNGNVIYREAPIQDPIAMVGEVCETKWNFDSEKRDFELPVVLHFKDRSARAYKQTICLIIDSRLHITVRNNQEPELIEG